MAAPMWRPNSRVDSCTHTNNSRGTPCVSEGFRYFCAARHIIVDADADLRWEKKPPVHINSSPTDTRCITL
jgi:hypothetical protein